MSLGEGIEIKKDGGAHEACQETFSGDCLPTSGRYISNESLSDNKPSAIVKLESQDGGQKTSVSENDDTGIGLPFLPELGTDCLDSYDSAVVENNTEWLKARCKTFGQIEFDIAPSSTGDDTLDFPGISLDSSKGISQDRLSTNATVVTGKTKGVTVISKSSTQGAQYATPYLTLSGTNISESDAAWHTVEVALGLQSNADNQKSDSAAENTDISLNLGDIDMNFLKTSLGVKDGVLTLFPNDPTGDVISENQSPSEQDSSGVIESETKDGVGATTDQQETMPSVGTVVLNTENVSANPNISGALALTTISIATDKMSNSTKILVDSSQGRQMYHLNISDLKKLENGATVNTGEQGTDNSGSSANIPSFIVLSNPSKSEVVSRQDPSEVVLTSWSGKEKAKTETLYMCDFEGCGKMFKNIAKLTIHNMSHTGQRPFKCGEQNCDWSFTKLYKLKRHMESHRGTKQFQCELCNKKFTTVYNLKTHLKHHKRPCKEVCPVKDCGQKFQTRRDLDKHLKTHVGVEKTYKCPHEGCNKLFLSPHCIGSHPRVHQMEAQNLTCQFEGCGRKFDKLCRLKQHQRAHTGERPYVCEYPGCNWAFSTASKLTRHMTKHTNTRKWVCNECGKAFMRSEHLKGHMITHTGIKPFICPIEGCGQKFVSKSSVYVHLKKHEKKDAKWSDITYHCPMETCDKKYNSKAKLRTHILKHFPETMKPEDAAQIDIVPLLHKGVGAKATVVEPSTVHVKTSQDGSIVKIDPVEYMATTVDTSTGESSTSVHNQFTAELTAELSNLAAVAETRSPTQTKSKKELKESEGMRSARTDYEGNQMLSERAKKRRKLLREKAAGSASEDTTSQQSVASPEESSLRSHAESEGLKSQGITFRDPETGVLYVQMQLLQDDPPHPGLYSDENVLNTQLDLPPVDTASQNHEFVGSTINLQDLVG